MLRLIIIAMLLLPLSTMAEVFKGRLKAVESNSILLQDGNKKKGTLKQKSFAFNTATEVRQKLDGKWQTLDSSALSGLVGARLAVNFDSDTGEVERINILKKKK